MPGVKLQGDIAHTEFAFTGIYSWRGAMVELFKIMQESDRIPARMTKRCKFFILFLKGRQIMQEENSEIFLPRKITFWNTDKKQLI